jgi:hypothetical protein
MSRFAPIRRFAILILDWFLDLRARLVERRDLIEQQRHHIDSLHEGWRRREADLLSQVTLKDREIKSLALINEAQNARIEALIAACARAAEDAKHVAPQAR